MNRVSGWENTASQRQSDYCIINTLSLREYTICVNDRCLKKKKTFSHSALGMNVESVISIGDGRKMKNEVQSVQIYGIKYYIYCQICGAKKNCLCLRKCIRIKYESRRDCRPLFKVIAG